MWEPCPPEVLPVGAGSEPGRTWHRLLQSGVCGCWVEVHMCLWVYSAVANSLRSHFGKVGVWISGFDEPLPGIIPITTFTFLKPSKLMCQFLLFSDVSVRFLDQIFHFLNCSEGNPFFCHLAIFKARQMSDCLQLYQTFLPRHSSRHVEKPPRH